jgi:hypothetical protein
MSQPRTAAEATELLLATQGAPVEQIQHEFISGLLQHFAELGIIDS